MYILHMKQHEDTRINENQAMATKIDMLATELSMAYIIHGSRNNSYG